MTHLPCRLGSNFSSKNALVFFLVLFVISSSLIAEPSARILFDFETKKALATWTNQNLDNYTEPAVDIELSDKHVTHGKHSLKLSYNGGLWPTVFSEEINIDDWQNEKILKADITLSRDAVA